MQYNETVYHENFDRTKGYGMSREGDRDSNREGDRDSNREGAIGIVTGWGKYSETVSIR